MSDEDNIEAAMNKVAETLEPTRQPRAEGEEAFNKQVLIRAAERDHERWKLAASKMGISMAEFMRDCANTRATDLLDCPHPLNERRYYPWAEFCLKCGMRLRSGPEKRKK
jgi:hypothetical protein